MQQIKWFSHCGDPFLFSLDMEISQVSTWSQAKKYCQKLQWENTTLEAQNSLTIYLGCYHKGIYQDWNNLAQAGREFIHTQVEPFLTEFKLENGLNQRFVDCVKWDLLGIMLEDAYREFQLPTTFYRTLFCIYERGHFPCGWTSGEWPEGKLIIF